ncbi:MAG: hypothetical protein WKH97_13920 [Casimicrobiaceae bacterium]
MSGRRWRGLQPALHCACAAARAGFTRSLTLVSRSGEHGELPRTIAAAVVEIFNAQWKPKLEQWALWLSGKVVCWASSSLHGRGPTDSMFDGNFCGIEHSDRIHANSMKAETRRG